MDGPNGGGHPERRALCWMGRGTSSPPESFRMGGGMGPPLAAEEEQSGTTNGRLGAGELGGCLRDAMIRTLSLGGGRLARGGHVPLVAGSLSEAFR